MKLSPSLHSYLQLTRLDKPTGICLLLVPCWWGLFLANPPLFPLKDFFLFLMGAIFMRGAGCTYNDMVDRDYDRQVRRTAARPLAANTLRFSQACLLLILQLLGGLIVLIQFPYPTILWGLASLVLVALYPWMKRFTYWPQAFLGLTFNWGIFLGWSIYQPSLRTAPFILYLAGICWTLGYDTIYAHQDADDDLPIGVKSSALALKHHTYKFLGIIYTLMMALLIIVGQVEELSKAYYVGLSFVALHLIWQVVTLDIKNTLNCLTRFKANMVTGLLIVAAFWMDWLQKF